MTRCVHDELATRPTAVSQPRVRVGLIGCGTWGRNVAAAADRCEQIRLMAVADIDENAARRLANDLQTEVRVLHPADLLTEPTVDAVLLVTDAATHLELATIAIQNGKHIFVEKPLALSTADCVSLVRAADRAGLTLMVGHTFLYSEYVARAEQALAQGLLGDLRYIHLQRLAYGRFRADVDVIWNLGPHDVSILTHWTGRAPAAVRCEQFMVSRPNLCDLAFMTLDFGDLLAHIHLSCIDPQKVRRATVAGTKAGILYDDVEGIVRLMANDTQTQVTLASGTSCRPLDTELAHFAACVLTGAPPKTDGAQGTLVAAVLESASKSVASGGDWIEVVSPLSQTSPAQEVRSRPVGASPETDTADQKGVRA